MKKFSFLLVIIVCFTQTVSAKIWRVNNKSNYNGTTLFGDNFGGSVAYPVFKEINNAVGWSAVLSGDTLHLEASPTVYANAVVSKKLIIIGPGYFLSENPKSSTDVISATLPYIWFQTGSAGSQLIGVNVVPNGNTAHRLYIDANDVTIKRCRIERAVQLGESNTISGPSLIQNFFPTTGEANAVTTNGNTFYVYPTDFVFNNNICQKTLIWAGPVLQCNNNVFDGPANTLNLQFSTSEFKNNILKPINASVNINSGSNLNASYNVGTATSQFGTANNNLVVADMNTIFTGTGSTDGKYQLKSASPASSNASDGTDRGAFGGVAEGSRYTLSGIGPIPVIYGISIPGTAGPSGLPVTIDARTIK